MLQSKKKYDDEDELRSLTAWGKTLLHSLVAEETSVPFARLQQVAPTLTDAL